MPQCPYSLFIGSLFVGLLLVACTPNQEDTYYIDPLNGDDSADGRSPETAWQSLTRAGEHTFEAGESLLLHAGMTFTGSLQLRALGTESQAVFVGRYGTGTNPKIDAEGFLAALHIHDSKHLMVRDLELTSDGGAPQIPEAETRRYGVLLTFDSTGSHGDITLRQLNIHDIFSTVETPGGGQRPTSNFGFGIQISLGSPTAELRAITIDSVSITTTGHTGIRMNGHGGGEDGKINWIDGITITNSRLTHIGGPGMVPSRCRNVLVESNIVNYSGSSSDPRMHNRGSGIWPWTSENVLIQHNRFLHARGKADSCGGHIDFNCKNVVMQYNLSYDNAGGFVEILGNTHNCAYRYNISINDGFRIKGENGAHQEGKVLWTSGYTGRKQRKHGPYNAYIYNNTVFVKDDIRSCFSFTPTTEGLFVANNVLYIPGQTVNVSGDQDTRVQDTTARIEPVIFEHNVYARPQTLPPSFSFADTQPILAPGLFQADDWVNLGEQFATAPDLKPLFAQLYAGSTAVLRDASRPVEALPGDSIGLTIGLQVARDFFGNPIVNQADIGAVELQ